MSIGETFEDMFRNRFGRSPTKEELTILVDQSVASYNQTGGITAHTVNLGKPHRTLNSPDGDKLKHQIRSELGSIKAEPWSVAGIMGDMESTSYADEIREFLKAEGFNYVEGVTSMQPQRPIFGVEVWKPSDGASGGPKHDYLFVVGAKP